MKKFKEVYYYRQPTFKLVYTFWKAIRKFSKSKSLEKQIEAISYINHLKNNWITNMGICSIRNSMNVNDECYSNEYKKTMSQFVIMQLFNVIFYKRLVKSKYKDGLKEEFGNQLFNIAEKQSKVMSVKVIRDMQKEFAVAEEYNKIIAKAQVTFEGKQLNLSELKVHMESSDETMRLNACKAYASFFKENEDSFDDIYDRLVALRASTAKKLGYKNYVELTYDKMSRDYTPEDVARYRENIRKYLVPITEDLRNRQAKRLGKEKLVFSDEAYKFTTGNANPVGDSKQIVDTMQKMYDEISPDAGKFFRNLTGREFLDLENREGKKQGGFCMPLPREHSPFVFANFNSTAHDVTVLTHECGHAYQTLNSMFRYDLFEYIMPTYEACEVHSMGMEFVAWPWYKSFYGEEEQKAKFTHLSSALLFIPYGVTVDEFQHYVYENPTATKAERKAKWAEIEQKYMPSKDFGEVDYFAGGTLWYRQQHIFNSPFYYIDYTLAQICAFQIWEQQESDFDSMWRNYFDLCTLGGSLPFVELIKSSGLDSPFETETITRITESVKNWLDKIDDTKL